MELHIIRTMFVAVVVVAVVVVVAMVVVAIIVVIVVVAVVVVAVVVVAVIVAVIVVIVITVVVFVVNATRPSRNQYLSVTRPQKIGMFRVILGSSLILITNSCYEIRTSPFFRIFFFLLVGALPTFGEGRGRGLGCAAFPEDVVGARRMI